MNLYNVFCSKWVTFMSQLQHCADHYFYVIIDSFAYYVKDFDGKLWKTYLEVRRVHVLLCVPRGRP